MNLAKFTVGGIMAKFTVGGILLDIYIYIYIWVQLLASVKFFIYSVASILQCSPCEVLEGPILTRVGII